MIELFAISMKHQACLTDNVQLKRIGRLTKTKAFEN